MLDIHPGVVAVIGAGGKTTLVRALASELARGAAAGAGCSASASSAAGASIVATGVGCLSDAASSSVPATGALPAASAVARSGRPVHVVVATSTKMFVPDWCPVLLNASLAEVRSALAAHPVVGVGSIHEPTGKLSVPNLAFYELAQLADHVLVEADGAKMLPLKAHAAHEPVIPDCAGRVVCVVGIDAVGKPVSQVCHRAEVFARLAGVSADDAATPEAIAAAFSSEGLHDVLLINKVHTEADWRAAKRIAELSATPVVAGSLQEGEFRCLR